MNALISRLLHRTPRAEHLTVTVYTRAQCCCCHKAIDVLNEAQKRFGFRIDLVDIDSDPELVAQYDTEVPVVLVDGKVRFRGVVNPALLNRLLSAER
jgi:glutaredoxin